MYIRTSRITTSYQDRIQISISNSIETEYHRNLNTRNNNQTEPSRYRLKRARLAPPSSQTVLNFHRSQQKQRN